MARHCVCITFLSRWGMECGTDRTLSHTPTTHKMIARVFSTHTATWTLSDFWAAEVSCLGYIPIETRTSLHRFPRLSDQPAGGGSLATTVMVDMSSPPRPSSGEFYGGLGIPGPRGRKGCVLAGKLFPSSRPAIAVTLPRICRAGLGSTVCWFFFQAMGVDNAPRN